MASSSIAARITDVLRFLAAGDCHAVLAIGPSATTNEIKKAYLTACRKFHPDKCSDDRATQAFQAVLEAYEVLSGTRPMQPLDPAPPQPPPPPPPPPPPEPEPKEMCAVCYEDVCPGAQGTRSLPCSAAHGCRSHFHSICIDTWLRRKRDCPLCKRPVPYCAADSRQSVPPPPTRPVEQDYYNEPPWHMDNDDDDEEEWPDSDSDDWPLDEDAYEADMEEYLEAYEEWFALHGAVWEAEQAASRAQRQAEREAEEAVREAEREQREAVRAETRPWADARSEEARRWAADQADGVAAWQSMQEAAQVAWSAQVRAEITTASSASSGGEAAFRSLLDSVLAWRATRLAMATSWLEQRASVASLWQATSAHAVAEFLQAHAGANVEPIRRRLMVQVASEAQACVTAAIERCTSKDQEAALTARMQYAHGLAGMLARAVVIGWRDVQLAVNAATEAEENRGIDAWEAAQRADMAVQQEQLRALAAPPTSLPTASASVGGGATPATSSASVGGGGSAARAAVVQRIACVAGEAERWRQQQLSQSRDWASATSARHVRSSSTRVDQAVRMCAHLLGRLEGDLALKAAHSLVCRYELSLPEACRATAGRVQARVCGALQRVASAVEQGAHSAVVSAAEMLVLRSEAKWQNALGERCAQMRAEQHAWSSSESQVVEQWARGQLVAADGRIAAARQAAERRSMRASDWSMKSDAVKEWRILFRIADEPAIADGAGGVKAAADTWLAEGRAATAAWRQRCLDALQEQLVRWRDEAAELERGFVYEVMESAVGESPPPEVARAWSKEGGGGKPVVQAAAAATERLRARAEEAAVAVAEGVKQAVREADFAREATAQAAVERAYMAAEEARQRAKAAAADLPSEGARDGCGGWSDGSAKGGGLGGRLGRLGANASLPAAAPDRKRMADALGSFRKRPAHHHPAHHHSAPPHPAPPHPAPPHPAPPHPAPHSWAGGAAAAVLGSTPPSARPSSVAFGSSPRTVASSGPATATAAGPAAPSRLTSTAAMVGRSMGGMGARSNSFKAPLLGSLHKRGR